MSILIVQLAWFILIGCLSAAMHWSVAIALVRATGINPLVANVAGWAVAFWISLLGHYRLTFRAQASAWWPSARRFLVLSATGFAVNETSYALLLRYTTLPFDLLLALVLIGVAGMTFVLSRLWAFRRSG